MQILQLQMINETQLRELMLFTDISPTLMKIESISKTLGIATPGVGLSNTPLIVLTIRCGGSHPKRSKSCQASESE